MTDKTPRLRWRDLRHANTIGFRLRCLAYLSGTALFIEKCFSPFLVILATVLVFLTVSLFGIWQVVGGWFHLALMAPFILSLVMSCGWLARTVKLPTLAQSIRRLEQQNNLSHQPFAALLDYPAGLPKVADRTQLFWNEHVDRAFRATKTLKSTWPSTQMARRDRFGIILTLTTFALLALLVAGEQSSARLTAAGEVHLSVFDPPEPGQLSAWISPPKYTGMPPIFLADPNSSFMPSADGKIIVAEGSSIIARVYGGEVVPLLRGKAAFGTDKEAPTLQREFEVVDASNYGIDHQVVSGGLLQIDQGMHGHGSWILDVLPDTNPLVDLVGSPEKTARSSLKLTYRAEDDYGIEGLSARIRPSDRKFMPIDLVLDVPMGSSELFEETGFYDLTSHPWAGFPATIELVAVDVAGGRGKSRIVEFELPNREFRHPLAQAVIEYRRQFAWRSVEDSAIRIGIERLYQELDPVKGSEFVPGALKVIAKRLEYPEDESSRSDIIDMLWEVALYVENGVLADAEKRLREAEAALRSALDRNASNEEIMALSEDLQAALGDFLEDLDRGSEGNSLGSLVEIERDLFGTEAKNISAPDDASVADAGIPLENLEGTSADAQELQDMASAVEDLALTGSREAAQNVLDHLRETLENLQGGGTSDTGAGGDDSSGQEELVALEDIMEMQDALLNETFGQMRDDPSDVMDPNLLDREQEAGKSDAESTAEPAAAGQDPPGLRDDQIERMDDLAGGQPAPTASRQSNSVQQSQQPQMPEQSSNAATQTRGEGEQGDMPASMTPPSLGNEAEEQAGEDQERATSAQNSPGSSSADGGGPEQGNNQISSGSSQQSPPDQPVERQESIRKELSDVIRGEGIAQERIPAQLARAEKHMRDASEALRRDRPDRAVRAQTQALNQLRQGVALLKGIQSGESGATQQSADGQSAKTERDPFGRKTQEMLGSPTGFVEIPEISEMQQSRRILTELYRRAGQAERSIQEREYIERLLKWY